MNLRMLALIRDLHLGPGDYLVSWIGNDAHDTARTHGLGPGKRRSTQEGHCPEQSS